MRWSFLIVVVVSGSLVLGQEAGGSSEKEAEKGPKEEAQEAGPSAQVNQQPSLRNSSDLQVFSAFHVLLRRIFWSISGFLSPFRQSLLTDSLKIKANSAVA